MRALWSTLGLAAVLSTVATSADAKVFRLGGITKTLAAAVDAASLVRAGDMVQGWAVYVAMPSGAEKPHFYTITKVEWDCARGRKRDLSGAVYNAKGENTGEITPTSWDDVIPDSAGDKTLKIACGAPNPGNEVSAASTFEVAEKLVALLRWAASP